MQDIDDLELVVIDDCSPDRTREIVASYADPRIRYVRNDVNVASKVGDREHLRRFVHELMRGKYFVYLCDDDYWLSPTLLRRQVEAFESGDNVVMVVGGQLSHYVDPAAARTNEPGGEAMRFTLENLPQYFDVATLTGRTPHLEFHQGQRADKSLFSRSFLRSEEYLREFAEDPPSKHIVIGATLYSREKFIESGVCTSPKGPKWQSGYELYMGPACYGNVVYFNEPAVLAEVRPSNASFNRTQVDHFLDSVCSIEAAFAAPLADPAYSYHSREFLKDTQAHAIRNTGRSYLHNTISHRCGGRVAMCSAENLSRLVTCREVLWALAKNDGLPTLEKADLDLIVAAGLPDGGSEGETGLTDGDARIYSAAALLDRWLEQAPQHAESLYLRALIARQQAEPASAVSFLHRAIAAGPRYADAHLSLGHALLDTGQADDAVCAFQDAVRLWPEVAAAHHGLGLALHKLGRWPVALDALQRTLTLEPLRAQAWADLGEVLCAVGQLEQAITVCHHALVIKPDCADARINLDKALCAAGRAPQSIDVRPQTCVEALDCASPLGRQ